MSGATRPPMRPGLALIAAVARNGAIGCDGGLLFVEPADQRHFRDSTQGCPVIMGRKTWDSLPPRFRPLPGRRNLVLSRDPQFSAPGAERVYSLEQALGLVADAPRVFVIGGAALYALALPLAQCLLLTEIEAELQGDTFFPPWDRSEFVETAREAARTATGLDYAFVRYERRT